MNLAIKVTWSLYIYSLLSRYGYRQKVIDKVIGLYLDVPMGER